MYFCIYVWMHLCMSAPMYVCVCEGIRYNVCGYVGMYVSMYVSMCMHACTHICVLVGFCVCLCVKMYVCASMYA